MRIVVTGGLGFVGQNFARFARKMRNDLHLTAIDWLEDATAEERAGFDLVHHACFAGSEAWPLYQDADVVLHLAAHTTVQESLNNPQRTFHNNVAKSQALLDHLRIHTPEALVVFGSTGGAIIGDHDGPIDESVPARPRSPYGASKLAVEGMLSAYQGAYGLRSASLRFSNVYGPHSRRKSSLVAQYCKTYLRDNQLQINGDGDQTRDFIYVEDIAAAIWRVIETGGTGVFQLGTGQGTSVRQIADHFQNRDPRRATKIVRAPALAGEVRHNRANIARASEVLGFSPRFGLAEGIEKTLAWFEREYAL